MKKIILYMFAAVLPMLPMCGCKCGDCGNDKPVAPNTFSNESGDSSEPSLPYMKPWWKN